MDVQDFTVTDVRTIHCAVTGPLLHTCPRLFQMDAHCDFLDLQGRGCNVVSEFERVFHLSSHDEEFFFMQ